MSPGKTGTGKRASYRLDRVLAGVGRLQVAIGSARLADYRAADALITKLHQQGRLDLLRQLKAGTLTVPELRDLDRREELNQGVHAALRRRPLLTAARDALTQHTPHEATRGYYLEGLATLERLGLLTADTTVGDLATLDWAAANASWPHSNAAWQKSRAAISRALTLLVGVKQSEWRATLLARIPRRAYVARMPGLDPDQFRAAVAQLPAPYAHILWALAGTGLRSDELWRLQPTDLEPRGHLVRVRGTKTEASDRTLALAPSLYAFVAAAVPIRFHKRTVRDAWHRACAAVGAPRTTLHDLRHCYGQWLLDEGIADADVQAQLGHRTAFMTRIYRMRAQQRATSEAMARVLVPQSVPQSPARPTRRRSRKAV